MKEKLICGVVLLVSCFVLGCSSSQKNASQDESQTNLAGKVDDWTCTRDDIQKAIDQMSTGDKEKYDTPGGRAALADELIQEQLYYREGVKMGLEKDEKVQDALKKYRNIKPLAYPSDEELHDYYEDNIDRFTRQPIARAAHIMSKNDPDKLREYKELVESGKEGFTALAQKYSEDPMTREQGGDLGYFNAGGYMRGVGYSDELSNAAFQLKVGEVSDPIKWKKGWSIIVLQELRPATVRPFEECKKEIEDIFVRKNKDRVKQLAYKELRKDYDVTNFLADEYRLTTRTPEELWNLAQNSTDSYERLRHYEEIVSRYPNSEHAAKALFMAGFVYAEELSDFPSADRAFHRVLNEYPNSDVVESAKYMLKTMRTPAPKFQAPNDSTLSTKP